MAKPKPASAWPADQVERRPVAGLIPYARNARTHSDSQVGQIAASITEWGWTVPVLVDEAGGIIAGHGRVLAAQKLGIADVPVMVARGWSEAQRRAYVLADNKLTLNGGWDDAMLRVELADLKGMGADLSLIGFSPVELDDLLIDKTVGLTDPDDVPEPPADPVTVLGDVWLLGRHRLVCGDSTTVEAVDAALAGVKPHLMVTDPPYLIVPAGVAHAGDSGEFPGRMTLPKAAQPPYPIPRPVILSLRTVAETRLAEADTPFASRLKPARADRVVTPIALLVPLLPEPRVLALMQRRS